MPQTADINKSRYEELKKNPVFFLKFFEYIRYDDKGNEIDYSTWRSLDRNLNINFDADNFADRGLGYCFGIVDNTEDKKDDKGNVIPDVVKMTFHNASPHSVNCLKRIFCHLCIKNFAGIVCNTENSSNFASGNHSGILEFLGSCPLQSH